MKTKDEEKRATKRPQISATRAAEIVNDIHEGLCSASKKELMACASFYSIRSCALYMEARSIFTTQATTALAGLQEFQAKHNR